ncbi:MAG: response regulator, partial [Desulfobacteraceae bacterium]|nr:response regulator [Desulfobacteraceae bacterium]
MKIMIVDDDNTTIFFLERILYRRGFEIVRAENGKVALERIQLEFPDIIISDIMMPELDGFEFYSTLRRSKATADIPFIFLSKKDDPSDQLKGLRMGADEYLVKPFSAGDILGTVDRVLEKSWKIKELKEEVDIAGNLAQIGLGEVVQLIEMSETCGELIVISPCREVLGTVYLKQGRVVDAVSGSLEGAEAFYVLAANTEGGFKFYTHDVSREDKINLQNINLLMEATRLSDESKALQ